MLVINKDSWHFNLLLDGPQENAIRKSNNGSLTLCWYFWQVVFGLLAWVGIIALACFIIAAIGFAVYAIGYIWYFLVAYGLFDVMSFDVDALNASMATNWLLALPALAYYLAMNLIYGVKWLNGTLKERPKKQPNIVTEYVKAKKQRICPMMRIE